MFSGTGDGMEFDQPSSSSIQWSRPCRPIEYPEILTATKNFDRSLVIGGGGFGKVYKGKIIHGASLVFAAIKRLDPMSNQGAEEFWSEVKMLSMLRHCNIVSLIGYCNHKNEKILVYEYMPNGTLDDHLHKHHTSIDWLLRLNICIGAGRGLRYLHNETGIYSGVIHRDFKSSNILLHESWAAKISDFGLSKTCPTNQPTTCVKTRVKGSYGYFDPSYYQTGMLTRKSDVYAFGVVLLETLCRKRAVDKSLGEDQWSLVAWVQDSIKKGKLKHIIDSDIRGEISPKCLKEYVKLIDRCLHNNPKERPTMVEVVASLENILKLQTRFNSSLRPAGSRTILGRMADMLPFPSNGENSVQYDPKLPSNNKGHNRISSRIEIPADFQTPTPCVKEYMFSDLEKATREFSPSRIEIPADFQTPTPSVKEYMFSDLEKATREFSPDLLLGEGGFGKVFLGWVEENTLAPSKQGVGIPVAVKRLNQESLQGHDEWLEKVKFFGRLAHPNIIRLFGYCIDGQKKLLIYEYMPNKSLNLFLRTAPDIAQTLTWETRLLIMIGIARALTYLHSTNFICGGFKSAHILLDNDFNAKLGNFGLQEFCFDVTETLISTRALETLGYVDKESVYTGHFSMETDIYSFGVILLESMAGRKVVNWASHVQSNRINVKEIMDQRLDDSYPLQGASKCVALAFKCISKNSKDRPSSRKVLQSLEQIYALYT